MQHVRDAFVGGARCDVDDLTALARLHVRRNVLHHQERAAHVHRHHLVPQRGVDLGRFYRL
jgi:hypothetical protein